MKRITILKCLSEMIFSKWSGPDGIESHIIRQTGCKPFSGAGINPRIEKKTTILKSVDDTYYYQDDLRNTRKIQYTLFGHNGNQDEKEPKFNEPLLNKDKTHHIYVYRVRKTGKQKEYIWYGKYEIVNKTIKQNIGKDKTIRNIIVLSLQQIE
jgi:hypothetical protein